MGHKADKSFFDKKRQWSKRKDTILDCYLTPYLWKIAKVKAPIFIVDAFAGPGSFADGESGSPLIICQNVKQALSQNLTMPVSVLCIESDEQLYADLKTQLSPFPFAQAKCGKFDEYIGEIEKKAKTHSVFLYVDPWTVEGLDWYGMERIFQHLNVSRMSIEILMNFNARSFVRRGLAALKLAVPESDPHLEDAEAIDAAIETPPSVEPLNRVVGGSWWQDILISSASFPQQVQLVTDGVCDRLSERFKEVCHHAVKALPRHTVPKYYLIFCSRHPDALLLMNNEMVKSQRSFAELAKPQHPTFFEMRPTDLIPDFERLPEIVLRYTVQPIKRKTVILNIIRECFCQFAEKEIRSCIEQLLRDGKLKSGTGKIRINDVVKIWAVSKIS